MPLFQPRTTGGAPQLDATASVAYFCAEYGITDALPIYSGGLGVLAGDIVQEAARKQLPFTAIGLFYRQGFFHQHLEADGQHETVEPIDPLKVPLELLRDDEAGDTLLIEVPVADRTVYAQVWRFPLGSNSLYLLDTDHWKNSEDDRKITDQLYGGDQEKRIQQELVLGLGGYRLLKRLGISPTVFHMNEGHSAFLSLEVLSSYMKDAPYDEAMKLARKKLLFTNHTLVAAGNDVFPHELVTRYLGPYCASISLPLEKLFELGSLADAPGFGMTMLAMRMASTSNAVSKLHAEKAVDLWPGFKLASVTNGVHLPAWIAPEWQHLLDKEAPAWRTATSDPASWQAVKKLASTDVWQLHAALKEEMLDEVYHRTGIRLDPEVLTVVWARRFASYKRPDLLFADLERLKKLLFHEKQPIQVIISGKSHPADGQGKDIIKHIDDLANYALKHRAVFVDDYSISLSKILVSGADVWLNTPIYGLEASGTSGMKASANGALQCTVKDGWAYEVDWKDLGFALPAENTEAGLYEALEKKIIPLFYKRNRDGVPEQWVAMMRNTIAALAPRFSSARMVEDYIRLYNQL